MEEVHGMRRKLERAEVQRVVLSPTVPNEVHLREWEYKIVVSNSTEMWFLLLLVCPPAGPLGGGGGGP